VGGGNKNKKTRTARKDNKGGTPNGKKFLVGKRTSPPRKVKVKTNLVARRVDPGEKNPALRNNGIKRKGHHRLTTHLGG